MGVHLWAQGVREAQSIEPKKIRRAMLNHLRCPHCGYDIRGLPTDPEDGVTVCPECGCAWQLACQAPTSQATPESRTL